MLKFILHSDHKNTFLFSALLWTLCSFSTSWAQIQPGAENTSAYLPILKDKKIAVVAHAASEVYQRKNKIHLVDLLLEEQQQIVQIFAPEHGFRTREDNGAIIHDSIDELTQLPIISLHGKNRKPTPEQLENIELVVFDLQDVGVRFYTYISTLHLVMEACSENNIPLLLLDRPNPNGHYVDGPVLETQFKSFLGMHPIPIVHGLTLGEFAQMINGEGWLTDGIKCDLTVVKIKNYTHQSSYELPVRPSPNLPNAKAINLYPSLCLFEQTPISIGRGTENQFQVFGHPLLKGNYSFTPQPNFGAKYPKLEGEKCQGENLKNHPTLSRLELKWLIRAYKSYPEKATFFSPNFVKLSGTKALEEQIQKGWSEAQIRQSWEPQLSAFKTMRKQYLLYPN